MHRIYFLLTLKNIFDSLKSNFEERINSMLKNISKFLLNCHKIQKQNNNKNVYLYPPFQYNEPIF